MGNSDNGNSFSLDRIVQNRIILLIAATVLGVGGNQTYQNLNPDSVRPDKWTASEDRAAMLELKTEMVDRFIKLDEVSADRDAAQDERLKLIEKKVPVYDAHLEQSAKGWELIYEMHEDIAVLKLKIDTLIDQHKEPKHD